MDPYLRLNAVRDNLALAVALWAAARAKHLSYRDVPSRASVPNDAGKLVEINSFLDVRNDAELNRLLSNQVRAAFAFSCLNAHEALLTLCHIPPQAEPNPDLRAARAVLYLLHRAVSRDLLQPVWDCPPDYQDKYQIRSLFFSLDAAAKEGQPVSWDDFGGMERYLGLLQFCADHLGEFKRGLALAPEAAPNPKAVDTPGGVPPPSAATEPALAARPDPSALAGPGVSAPVTVPTSQPQELPAPAAEAEAMLLPFEGLPASVGVAAVESPIPFSTGAVGLEEATLLGSPALVEAAQPVRAFVAARCVTDPGARILARQLYDAYLDWCAQEGQPELAQRSFGMRLTEMGFARRRRGRGRHWWEGVGLLHPPAQPAPEDDDTAETIAEDTGG